MLIFKILLFAACVLTTLDFIVDTIEIMSGRSKDHKILGETTPSLKYQLFVVVLWTIFFILMTIT